MNPSQIRYYQKNREAILKKCKEEYHSDEELRKKKLEYLKKYRDDKKDELKHLRMLVGEMNK